MASSTIERTAPRIKMTWWQTEKGIAAASWLSAWGKVVRERQDTGDPTAVPCPDGALMGGSRSSPSNVADVLLAFMEVDQFLNGYATGRQQRLARFVYVDGVDHREMCQVEFQDGTLKDWQPYRKDLEDSPQVAHLHMKYERVQCYDLMKFEAPEVDEVCKLWHIAKRDFLDMELIRLAKGLVNVKGL